MVCGIWVSDSPLLRVSLHMAPFELSDRDHETVQRIIAKMLDPLINSGRLSKRDGSEVMHSVGARTEQAMAAAVVHKHWARVAPRILSLHHIGASHTAVDAAVAYAKHVAKRWEWTDKATRRQRIRPTARHAAPGKGLRPCAPRHAHPGQNGRVMHHFSCSLLLCATAKAIRVSPEGSIARV